MILRINSDYFFKQRQPVDLCNGEVLCFLCGTDWILKYYLDELRLQKVNFKSVDMYLTNAELFQAHNISFWFSFTESFILIDSIHIPRPIRFRYYVVWIQFCLCVQLYSVFLFMYCYILHILLRTWIITLIEGNLNQGWNTKRRFSKRI
jgi:hypothetical protein